MFRELTKSVLSFSWALSLLGIKQVVNLGRSGQNGGDPFGPVTQVAVTQLDESMKGIFRSGDNLQSRMVDVAFASLNPANWLNPSSWANIGNLANPANGVNPASWIRSAVNFAQGNSGGCCGKPSGDAGQTWTASPSPGAASGPSSGNNVPVSNASPAAGWGPMPGT
jgi:hypothetical protein